MAKAQIRVLLVEDDPNLGFMLQEYLGLKDCRVTWAKNGVEGEEEFNNSDYDILLLDVMMPKLDGFSLIQRIRKVNKEVPAIFLTAKGQTKDVIEGFDLGADDYLTKPFSMEVLLARMKALLRRTGSQNSSNVEEKVFEIGSFEFNVLERNLSLNGKSHKLTSKESGLLEVLISNKGELVERDAILKSLWKDDSYFSSRSMDVYLSKLRKYLSEDPAIELQNVHGEGYRLVVSS